MAMRECGWCSREFDPESTGDDDFCSEECAEDWENDGVDGHDLADDEEDE